MPMTRAEKEQEAKDLNVRFAKSDIVIVTRNEGLFANEMNDLRARAHASKVQFKVSKNTLARRALEGTSFEHLADMLKGPVGIATSNDPVGTAKLIYDFAKDHKKLVVLGGGLGVTQLDAAAVETLAKLPSLDELRARLLGLLMAPATKVAGVLQAPAAQLARVVGAYAAKG